MNNVVETLWMFEFCSWEEATSNAGKAPTTMKLIDGVKKDNDGRELVLCRLVARDFKPRREGQGNNWLAAMPPLRHIEHCLLTRLWYVRRGVNRVRTE